MYAFHSNKNLERIQKCSFLGGDAIMEGFDCLFFLHFQTYTCVIIEKVINKGIMNNKKVMNNVITYKLSA